MAGIYSRLENDTMAGTVEQNLKFFSPLQATPQDKQLVKQLGKKPVFNLGISDRPDTQDRGSSDEDNVSWLSPYGRFNIACLSKEGVAGHHRDYAAQMKLPFAHRATLKAAQVLAGSALDLYTDPQLLLKAKREFKKRTRGFKYDPLVPKRQKPPSVNP